MATLPYDSSVVHDVGGSLIPVLRPVRGQDGRRVADEAVDAAGRAQLVQEAGHVIWQSHYRSHFYHLPSQQPQLDCKKEDHRSCWSTFNL